MWDAAGVALLKKLGPEARPQIANRQAQDRVDPEAKTGAVGSLRPTGR